MGSSEANRQYLRLNPLRDHEGEYAAGSAANQVLPPRAAKLYRISHSWSSILVLSAHRTVSSKPLQQCYLDLRGR
jgi:hypothetical protein